MGKKCLFDHPIVSLQYMAKLQKVVEFERRILPHYQRAGDVESLGSKAKWAQSYKVGPDQLSVELAYNPRYPFIRTFIGVTTPFLTGRGPPCNEWTSIYIYIYMSTLLLSSLSDQQLFNFNVLSIFL